MAKNETIDKSIAIIKKAIKDNKLVIGTERTFKLLRAKNAKEVYVTANCPAQVFEDIERYSNLSETKISKLSINNDELGAICKKPFSISIIAVQK